MITHSVFVIDDDSAVRDSLITLFRGEGLRARGFASGVDFFDALPDDRAACIVTDLRMPGMDGAQIVQRVAQMTDRTWPIIVITGHADVPMAVQLMKAGIADFIEKPFDPNRMIEIVRASLEQLEVLGAERESRARIARLAETLTPRERQVFDALILGQSNKEIAQDLEISPRTVEIFRAKVMAKMEADSLSALVRMGLTLAPLRTT